MQPSGTLAANEITIYRGAHAVLERVSLTVPPGARIGVVGPNGRGKTTLLRVLAGLDPPDRGSVTRSSRSLRVGYLPQERRADPAKTVADCLGRWSGEALDWRAGRAVAAAGADVALHDRLGDLSGGQVARVALASILLARFDVYLLDEPTNDLDFEGLDLLERFVRSIDGAAVIVSHDRTFLDRTVDRIVELEAGTPHVRDHAGGWSDYEAARARARLEHQRAYTRWEEEHRRFADLHAERREQARTAGKQASRRGTHALMSKTRAAAKRLERLEEDRVEKPWQPWQLRLSLASSRRAGDLVVALESAVVERGRFRLGPIDLRIGSGERISIAGRNGVGKSTLLDAVLGKVPLASGVRHLGPSVIFGEIAQARTASGVAQPTIEAFCGETDLPPGEARTLLAKFGLHAGHVARPAETLSPGERTRAELAVQVALGANCLVLDEPTNHLDVPAIEELERALADYDGTLLLVTHDRRFLEQVGTTRQVELD